MKEKYNNENHNLSEFLRYVRGEMTKREENAFQRKLQKDPFAEEATEGFSGISTPEATDDMNRLEKLLKTRITRRERMIFYRIAASVAVLMVISSVFIVIERNKPSDQLSDVSFNRQKIEAPQSKAITEPQVQPTEKIITLPEKEADRKDEPRAAYEIPRIADSGEQERIEAPKQSRVIAGTNEQESGLIIREEKTLALADETEIQKKPDSFKSDYSEMVAAGNSTSISLKATAPVTAEKADDKRIGYTEARPVNGKESFDKYIEENIRKPFAVDSGENAVVVISFNVRSSGIIDSIKVIQSPRNEYSEEAIRLIKESPAWKPAEENGEKIDDEVSLRIIFR
jgi:outer membrane biosynthesis protein TonB